MQRFEFIKLKEISLKVHPSWTFILALFTVASQGQFSRVFGDQFPIWHGWFIGLLTSLALFLSVVLLELGHYLVALNEGVKIKYITVSFLGGFTGLNQQSSKPISTFKIAIAGPLVSISIGIFCFYNIQFISNPIVINFLAQIGSINFVLAAFKLLPCLPLNGGVILKSLIWHLTGSQLKGNKIANLTGTALSLSIIFLGVIMTFGGGGFRGLWLIILGWFGFTSSKSHGQLMILEDVLSKLSVVDSSRKSFKVFEQDNPIKVLSDLSRTTSQEENIPEWVFLCDSGRWIGFVTDELIKEVPVKYWDDYLLASYSRPLSELPSISEKTPLWEAVLSLEKEYRLLVFNSAGLPSGTIDKVDIAKTVLNKLGLDLPKTFLDEARKNNIYPLGISLINVVKGMLASGLIQESDSDKSNK